MRFITVFLFATVISFFKLAAQAPVNDDCSGALNIIPASGPACAATVVTSNLGATQSMPGCTGAAEDDIWFKFTATSTRHLIQVYNGGADYPDAVLEIFSGSCGSLASMGCYQDADGAIFLDLSTFNTGQTYYCRYYGAGAANERTSKLTICVSTPPIPVNDECAGALEIPVNSDTSTVKNLSGSLGYPTQSLPNCFSPGKPASDAWFKFTATSAAHYITVSSTSSTNYVYEVFSGSCSNLVSLECVNPINYSGEPDIAILKNLVPGQVYYLRLYDNYNYLGSNISPQYKIVINTAVPDDCSGAITVTPGIETYCTKNLLIPNKGASSSAVPVCYGDAEDNIWFKFTATSTGHRINVSATDNVNPVIEVFSGSCGSLISMGCYYTNYGVPYKDISADLSNLLPGNIYYYRVYGAESNSVRTVFNTCISSSPLALPGCVTNVYYPQDGSTISSYSSVNLQWFNISLASSYDLYVWSGATPPTAPTVNIIPGELGNTVYSMTALAASTTYKWYIVPRNAVGAAAGCTATIRTFTTLPQGPINDNCTGAVNIPVNAGNGTTLSLTGNLINATASYSPSCNIEYLDTKDVWYKFTATATSHKISISSFEDPVFEVYSGQCATLKSIACVNNTGSNVPEMAIVNNLIPGDTYYIRLYYYGYYALVNGSAENFTITINSAALLADNDDCTGAYLVSPDVSSVYAHNVGATQSMPGCYGAAEDDIWFKFTATNSRHLIEVYANDYIKPVLEVFSGACSSLTSIKCNHDMGSTYLVSADIANLIPGQTYYYRVYGAAADNARTRITTSIISLPPAPLNDECEGAISIPVNNNSSSLLSYTGNTGYASQGNLISCDALGTTARDVWFTFTATGNSHKITVAPVPELGNPANYVFQVYSGTCGNLTPLVCVNTGGMAEPDTTIVNNLIPGNIYYIRLYNFNNSPFPNYYFKLIVNRNASQAQGTGLLANYYNGIEFSNQLLTRIDTAINFELTYSKQPLILSPAPGIVPEDKFSIRWTGKIQPQFSETYTFYTVADDGIRLRINGQILIDNLTNQSATEKSGSIILQAGQQYDIVIEYYENTGEAVAKLFWSSPSTPKTIVPKSQLFPPTVTVPPSCTLNNLPVNGSITGNSTAAVLSWNSVQEAEGYKVYVWQAGSVPATPLATVSNNNFSLTGLLPSTTYRWYIVPFNAAGDAVGCSNNTLNFITASADASAGNGTGLQGVYFNGTGLSGTPLLTRTDTTINFELTYSKQPLVLSPAPGIVPEDLYSVRWTGRVQPKYSEPYTFYTVADDGVRLWVNGVLLVDNWTNQGATEKSGSIALIAGQKYDIIIEYYESGGEAVTKLLWSSANTTKAIIPKTQLYPPAVAAAGGGLQGIYYNGTSISGTPLLTRIDTTINFELTYSKQPLILSPAPGIVPEDLYSVRWTGQVQPLYSETYTFYTVADDGIRLWVNGQLLVDNWTNQGATEKTGTIALVGGQKYDIVIEYYESGGEAVTKLLWSSPSTPKQVVPPSQLYPPAAGARVMSSNLPVIAANVLPASPAVSAYLSPNPVRPGNFARLQISSNKAGTGIITISSSNGRMVSTEKIKLVTGLNTAILPTRGLAQGLYIITVTGGSKPINLKLLVE